MKFDLTTPLYEGIVKQDMPYNLARRLDRLAARWAAISANCTKIGSRISKIENMLDDKYVKLGCMFGLASTARTKFDADGKVKLTAEESKLLGEHASRERHVGTLITLASTVTTQPVQHLFHHLQNLVCKDGVWYVDVSKVHNLGKRKDIAIPGTAIGAFNGTAQISTETARIRFIHKGATLTVLRDLGYNQTQAKRRQRKVENFTAPSPGPVAEGGACVGFEQEFTSASNSTLDTLLRRMRAMHAELKSYRKTKLRFEKALKSIGDQYEAALGPWVRTWVQTGDVRNTIVFNRRQGPRIAVNCSVRILTKGKGAEANVMIHHIRKPVPNDTRLGYSEHAPLLKVTHK